jgi:hypothetical protein
VLLSELLLAALPLGTLSGVKFAAVGGGNLLLIVMLGNCNVALVPYIPSDGLLWKAAQYARWSQAWVVPSFAPCSFWRACHCHGLDLPQIPRS